jgi:hypothetical protein
MKHSGSIEERRKHLELAQKKKKKKKKKPAELETENKWPLKRQDQNVVAVPLAGI